MGNPENEADESLMREYLAGSYPAFQSIYERYSGKIYSYLMSRLRNREEVDEVFQGVFLKFHQSRSQYNSKYPLLQWLYVISKSVLIDHQRSRRRKDDLALMSQLPSGQALPDQELVDQEVASLASSDLSADQKQIVRWRVLDELTYEEIAHRLDRSPESIRQTVSRALRRMKKTWAMERGEK